MHITQFQPAIDWSPGWGNLLNTILFDGVRSTWFIVIHDTLSINVWLHRIWLSETENCSNIGGRTLYGPSHRMQGETGDLELDPPEDSYDQRHGYVGGIIVNIQFAHSKKNIWNEVKIFLANSAFCEIDIIVYSKAWLFKENKNGFKEKTYFIYFYLQLNIARNINFNELFI